jgi:two-component system phosphate regulon sensor histidine kinase PhoR
MIHMPDSPPLKYDPTTAAALIEALRDPVAIIGKDTRLTAANASMRAIVPGLRAGELLVLSLRSPDILDALGRVLAGGPAETTTWRERAPVERLFEVTVGPLPTDEEHGGRLAVLTLRDLTEARRLERMRVDFIANASHELRTPLASVLGFIETLQGAAREDPLARAKFLSIMRDQARRMSRLIEDLLSLSRIEQNEHLRPSEAVNLSAVVGHVVDTLSPMARENNVTLDVASPGEIVVAGERDELVRVAENLIENAIKYGAREDGQPSTVEIKLAGDGREACFSVRDHGPGIAPEHLPRLTERFYRVDAGASRAKGGTGLGLAIVKHIVARHRGRLSVQSNPGDGATFKVTLPALAPLVSGK